MVHYLRFFKPPKVYDSANGAPSITTVITIQNDLGDLFLGSTVDVEAVLLDTLSSVSLQEQTICEKQVKTWQAGDMSMTFTVRLRKRYSALRLHMRTNVGDEADTIVPAVIPAWSATFGWGTETSPQAECFLERQFIWPGDLSTVLRVWEQTGNSIACHVWDAAIGFLLLFHNLQMPKVLELLESAQKSAQKAGAQLDRRIIELGAGCGIVGIAISRLLPLHNIILTDQTEAIELIEKNTKSRHSANPRIQTRPLVWGSHCTAEDDFNHVDLILVSDCTYNPDSGPALTETLSSVASASPEVRVLVGMKRRHASEDVFFELMKKRQFLVVEKATVILPHMPSFDGDQSSVEIYLFEVAK
ncbi:MAG: hypothetical protein Q9227_003244 [Pyrenula ochraceoflavens]